MRTLIATLLILLTGLTTLEARTLGFTDGFPDKRLRGKAYDLSDGDYARARAMGNVILEKNEELFGNKIDDSGDIDTQIQRWNRLRRENNQRMDELRDLLNSRGTRIR